MIIINIIYIKIKIGRASCRDKYNSEGYNQSNLNNISYNKKLNLEIIKNNYINISNDSKNSSFQENDIHNDYNNNFIYSTNNNSKRNYKSETVRIELRENKWDKSSESN